MSTQTHGLLTFYLPTEGASKLAAILAELKIDFAVRNVGLAIMSGDLGKQKFVEVEDSADVAAFGYEGCHVTIGKQQRDSNR